MKCLSWLLSITVDSQALASLKQLGWGGVVLRERWERPEALATLCKAGCNPKLPVLVVIPGPWGLIFQQENRNLSSQTVDAKYQNQVTSFWCGQGSFQQEVPGAPDSFHGNVVLDLVFPSCGFHCLLPELSKQCKIILICFKSI